MYNKVSEVDPRVTKVTEELERCNSLVGDVSFRFMGVLSEAIQKNALDIIGTLANEVSRRERASMAGKLKELTRFELEGKDIRRGLYGLIGELECTE